MMRPVWPGQWDPIVSRLKLRAKLPEVDDLYSQDLVPYVRGWRSSAGLPPQTAEITEELLKLLDIEPL